MKKESRKRDWGGAYMMEKKKSGKKERVWKFSSVQNEYAHKI